MLRLALTPASKTSSLFVFQAFPERGDGWRRHTVFSTGPVVLFEGGREQATHGLARKTNLTASPPSRPVKLVAELTIC